MFSKKTILAGLEGHKTWLMIDDLSIELNDIIMLNVKIL